MTSKIDNAFVQDFIEKTRAYFKRPGMYIGTDEDTEENRKKLIQAYIENHILLNYTIDKKYAGVPPEHQIAISYPSDKATQDSLKLQIKKLEEKIFSYEFWKTVPFGSTN